MAHVTQIRTKTLQSISIRWITNPEDRDAIIDDLMDRTEHSDTWPFMDWVDEAFSDPAISLLGAYNSDLGMWAGFFAFRYEQKVAPVRPGVATIHGEFSMEYAYMTESERKHGISDTMVMISINHVNETIEAARAENPLLRWNISIAVAADCFDAASEKLARKSITYIQAHQGNDLLLQDRVTTQLEDELAELS